MSGRVTLDGKPVPDAKILFSPIKPGDPNPGLGSYGKTDSDGRYKLQLVDKSYSGAQVGTHSVELSAAPPGTGDAPGKDPIPARYHAGILKFTVPVGGTSSADFDSTTKP